MDAKTKAHPDYLEGYTDAINGRKTELPSVPYDAGWAAGTFAREALGRAGFEQDGEGTFSLTLGVRP